MMPKSSDQKIIETPLDAVRELERELGLPNDFYVSLLNEDDWSFVIKLHSLFEAAVSGLIVAALGTSEVNEIVSWLELSNKRTGKMAFVKALDLLDEDFRRYISSLSELRNSLAHDISNVNISLQEYFQRPGKLSAATKSFCVGYDSGGFDESRIANEKRMRENPKKCIWSFGTLVLGITYLETSIQISKNNMKATLGKTW